MKLQGALIREQGVDFAVVVVKRHVVENTSLSRRTIVQMAPTFGVPVVLMAQDHRGTPTYFGRQDLVRFLSQVPLEAIPWQEFTVN